MVPRTLKRLTAASLVAALAFSLAACGKGSSSGDSAQTDASGTATLKLWTHNAGNDKELAAINQIVTDYNGSQSKYKVEVQAFPQESYNTSVTAAAASKSLPCILDVDGPNVANWAWGRLPGAAGRLGRADLQVPAQYRRRVQRQELRRRLLRRGADHGGPQVGAGGERDPDPDHRRPVDRVSVTTIVMSADDDGEIAHVVFVGTADDYQFELKELFDHLDVIEAYRLAEPVPQFSG